MNAFFTADTHFGSARTLAFSRRPFESTRQMDDTIVNNWNDVVGKNDIIYHQGDFGDFEISKKLNGKIILLFGNYEREEFPVTCDEDKIKWRKYFKDRYNIDVMFEPIKSTSYLQLDDGNRYSLLLTHEPTTNSPKITESGIVNLFAHIHKLCMIKRYGLNVGVDCHDFAPIDADTVKFYINAIANHYDKNVFE